MELFVSDRVENIVGQGENAGFPAFSAFLTMFSKGFFIRVVKIWKCLGKGKAKSQYVK